MSWTGAVWSQWREKLLLLLLKRLFLFSNSYHGTWLGLLGFHVFWKLAVMEVLMVHILSLGKGAPVVCCVVW